MKRIVFTGLFMLCSFLSIAQGVGSFFDQGNTRIKTMLQQIALQQTYLSEIKKGYRDTENGLNTAHELKNGTFNLHQTYFNSLSQVSPAVKNNPKIKLVTAYEQQIMTSFDNELSWEKQQGILASDEISYIEKVYNNMLTACTRDLDQLNIVVTPGLAQMKDAERIEQIDKIYTATDDKYKFSMSFTQNSRAFALNRQNGGQQTQVLQKLYDLK